MELDYHGFRASTTMLFWPIRLLLLLSAFPLAFIRWQVALVVVYAVAVDFVIFLGMTLPGFGLWGELVLVFPPSVLIGIVLWLGNQRDRLPTLVAVSTLVVLHASTYAVGQASAAVVLGRLPALGVLVFAVALGLELTHQVRRLRRGGKSNHTSSARN
jgi:CHASE2 domain-containing sensor protein